MKEKAKVNGTKQGTTEFKGSLI